METEGTAQMAAVPVTPKVESMNERLDRVVTALEDLKKDQAGSLDAIKELTKQVGTLVAEWEKWRKAGKF